MNCTSINDCPYRNKYKPVTRYQLRLRLQNDLLVWCKDGRWHNVLDLGDVHKPVYYGRTDLTLGRVLTDLKNMGVCYMHTVLD